MLVALFRGVGLSSETPSPHYPTYAFGLDIIRLGCALMVALFHFSWRTANEAGVMPFGWVGVQVFFVISGVVIAMSATSSTPYLFVRSRFLRLYPAAWIAAAISFAVLSVVPWSAYQALGIGVIPRLGALGSAIVLVGEYALATAYWTLPIEIAFYLVVYIAMLRGGSTLPAVGRLLALASGAYIVCLSYMVATTSAPGMLDLGYGLKNMLLLRHGVFFAIGIYMWMGAQRMRLDARDRALLVFSIGAGMLEIVCRALSLEDIFAVGAEGPVDVRGVAAAALLVFAVLSTAIFASLVNAGRWVPSARSGAAMRMLGLVTYPFYLLHEVVGGAVLYAAIGHDLGRPASLALALGVALAIAWLVAAFAEPRLRALVIAAVRWARGTSRRILRCRPAE